KLLTLAEEVGDSIGLIKTHSDTITGFNNCAVKRLHDMAKRKRFLLFEDKKSNDLREIYIGGPLAIARWADIRNAHIFPAQAIVTSIKKAA
ncbi:hypothetical protein B0J12DRAFT_547006, partial [Macrophomina phaseolina]